MTPLRKLAIWTVLVVLALFAISNYLRDRQPVPVLPSSGAARRLSYLLTTASICYMTTPKPKPLPVRIPADMVGRIDRLRGLIPREAYVRDILDRALKLEERRAARR